MDASLPDGLTLQRTAEFDSGTVPAGLLRAHRLAEHVWAIVRVRRGSLRFVWEADAGPEDDTGPEDAVDLGVGDSVVVPPRAPHRVELGEDTEFSVEFYR
ncbi:MAG: DUF1971 domain-containing protein [Microthrixaceae bacterium]